MNKELDIKKTESVILKEADINIGEIFIDRDGQYLKIDSIDLTNHYEEYIHMRHLYNGEWHSYGNFKIERFKNINLNKVNKPIEEFEKECLNEFLNLKNLEEEEISSTSLVSTGNVKNLQVMEKEIELKRRRIEMIKAVVERKKSYLSNIASSLEKKINKIRKVIKILDLYMGIKEQIVQIQKGKEESIEIPITFRQMVLYMDEEVGVNDIYDEGMDAYSIKTFDDWVTTGNNINRILPEKKGIVALKPRRYDKSSYKDLHFLIKMNYQIANKQTYLLIRNGDNIYRLIMDIDLSDSLFPKKAEMDELLSILGDEEKHSWHKERTEDYLLKYKEVIIYLQGLIERTDIFSVKPGLFLFKSDTWKGSVKLIYDNEPNKITSGKNSYKEWHDELAEKIQIGSRVYFTGFSYRYLNEDNYCRYDISVFNHYVNLYPQPGIYTVQRFEKRNNRMCICLYYNPKDEIWTGGWSRYGKYKERKKSISFFLPKNSKLVLNYDIIELKDVEYYLNNRIDRENYYEMLPALIGFYKLRKEEIKWENGLVNLLVGEFGETARDLVEEKILWWKIKTKIKRPITSNDKKALRMIRSKIDRELKENKNERNNKKIK